MFLKQALTAIIALSILTSNLPAQTIPVLSALCLQYKPYSIDISSLTDFYETLPADEKEEQMRDWAYYGLLISLAIEPSEINELTGTDFPMRYASLKDKYKFQILPGRSSCPDGGDCVMLVARGETENRLLQGFIYDKQRMPAGEAPERVHIFAYSAGPEGKTINISFVRTVPGSVFHSPDYGYFEKEINGADSLKEFLDHANYIVSARIRKDLLILAGRKNTFGGQSSLTPPDDSAPDLSGNHFLTGLTFEDVVVLQQAYINRVSAAQEKERRKNYDIFLSKKYNELLSKDKNLRKAVKAKKIKFHEIMTRIRKTFPYTPLYEMDSNVGFSLDPLYDYGALAEELISLAGRTGKFSTITKEMPVSKAIDARLPGLLEAAAKVKARRDITPLLKFRRALSAHNDDAELQLDSALQMAEMENTYQAARYDGKLKGTSAAMILFYTDLTAKLWALDYNGISPKGITGFKALCEIKVPKLYLRDFIKLSKTRLWFGLRGDSFDIDGNDIYFEPVSARVYAASSDPLYPGKESKPNYQSGEFLGWWDAHYVAVADYEPYYYKLNELLKWSCVMMVLKEKNSHCLDFLSGVPVTRTLDFEAWYKNNARLKNKTELPYVDGSRFNKTTECFKMLQSKGYPLMGATFFVSGGISLASKKDIAKKISRHRQGGGGVGRKVAGRLAKKDSKEYSRQPVSGKKLVSATAAEPAKNNFGEFSSAKQDRSLKLHWSRNEGAVLDECVNTLAAVQTRAGREGRSESIFRGSKDFQKVVRIQLGKTYLIRPVSLKDKWIYVSVDPEGKIDGFPAKAAGTEPDSSVFYAKTVTSLMAEKIIQQNKGVTLFE